MPRKKNRRKEIQAKRRADEAAKAPEAKPQRRVGIIAHHHPSSTALLLLAASAARLGKSN